MTNAEIAAVFDQVADLLEFQNANPLRVRAYRNGARAIREMPESIEEIVDDPKRDLTDIAGIGKDLAGKVATLLESGSLPLLDELQAQIPSTVLAMMRVPGLGPKRAAMIFHELKVTDLDQLRDACVQHRVQELKGFGAKTEAAILQGLDIAQQAAQRVYWAEADEIVQSLRTHLRGCAAIQKLEFAGSYRRGRDTVGDLDLLVVASDHATAMEAFARFPGVGQILAHGDTKMSVRLTTGFQVDLRVVPEESFGAALQYFTGSKAHNVLLRGMAKAKGLKINEYGVFRGDESLGGRTEEEVYGTLSLPVFPPELREARQEFEWASAGPLPELVELADIRADLHAHSTWTDGLATIEEMAEAAKHRGLAYLAITDHSKRVAMVGGLDGDRLRRQWEDIDRLNAQYSGFQILKGVEVDILEGGGLDLEDDVLAEADWVVASVHYGQHQPRERITRRVVEALENPYVWAIAHPTGRLLNRRNAYEIDLDAVFRAARDHRKFLELNAHPSRLDLDDLGCAMAKNYGVPVVISTDAHSISGLDAMRYGVLQARRGGLARKDVANTRTWAQLRKLRGLR
jgi:DNA polymerase (family 10)